jgi:Ca2+-binding RTX toxin-like protein
MRNIVLSTLDGTDGFRLDGIDIGDRSGFSVSGADDVNGDGFADLIIGAYLADPNFDSSAGESYVVFGKAAGFTAGVDLAGLDGSDGFRLDGIDDGDLSGRSVSAAGDVNGDGFGDLIVGARGAAFSRKVSVGESYVVFGKASGFTAGVDPFDLDGTDGFILDGIDLGDVSGDSVSAAGDVNGDGFADLVVGAMFAAPNGDNRAGESYVVFGFDSGAVTHEGTNASETLTGDATTNVMIGGQGVDVLLGAGGQDVFRGGAGDDIFTIDDLTFEDADGGAGTDTLRLNGAGLSLDLTAAGDEGLSEVEAIDFSSTNGGVTLSATAVLGLSSTSNSLTITGNGDDTVTFTDNGWMIAAEDGATRTYENGAATVILDRTMKLGFTGSDQADVFLGMNGDDTLAGAAGDDVLTGGNGNDDIDGEAGDDRLIGGLGDDDLNGGADEDTADYSDAGAGVTVNLTSGAADDGEGGTDALTALENIIGSAFNDILSGNAGDNDLSGNAGNDQADYSSAGAGVTVSLTSGSANDGEGGTDTLTGIENIVGSAFNDILTGDGVANVLSGGGGVDQVDYSGATAGVVVNLTAGRATDDASATDTLIDIENAAAGGFNDVLIGDSAGNTLVGGAGIDRLDGRDGDDRLEGGAGDDIYTVRTINDVVVEGVGEGAKDRINTFGDYTNPENVEFLVGIFADQGLTLTGSDGRESITGSNRISSPDTIDGRGGNDKLVGLVGDDILIGGAGNDRIFGNSGADVINGSAGNDRVTGQQGADTFIVGLAAGRDTITDFDGAADQIDLSAHGFADLAAVLAATTDVSGSAIIDLGGVHNLKVLGVLEASFTSDDFILA